MTSKTAARLSSAHYVAADLEAFLGQPEEPQARVTYREIVESEERDELAPGAVAAAEKWGFQSFLVPRSLGGRLDSLEELVHVSRVLSRRTTALAIRYGSALLGANPVWLWGSAGQQQAVAAAILEGDLISFGISEADHGSDLLANETGLEADGDQLRLTGRKWPVGNAGRARFMVTLARSGKRSFSLVLFDKQRSEAETWSVLPQVKTLGLRGHDLSGLHFTGAPVNREDVLGRDGTGLAQVLKTLQITRTAICALSLGTMDAALRIALRHAEERRLYGAPASRIPVISGVLAGAHLDLLISECMTVAAARALAVAPTRLSLWSSIVKYFVPTLGEEVVAAAGRVLGARSYLREGVADGAFQKIQRDHAIASIFEGTTHVNLHAVADQLPSLTRRAGDRASGEERAALIAELFSWTREVPAGWPTGADLRLSNEGHDEITQSWPDLVDGAQTVAAEFGGSELAELPQLLGRLTRVRDRITERVGAQARDDRSARALALAEEHCIIHAAACVLATWLTNRAELGGAFGQGSWAVLSLQRLLSRLDREVFVDPQLAEDLLDHARASLRSERPFSLASLADVTTHYPS
jgi:alkylation response protein AidB-like acyl-CoA dehydrogenase